MDPMNAFDSQAEDSPSTIGRSLRNRPLARKKLSEMVEEELEQMIRRREFGEGEQLPSERQEVNRETWKAFEYLLEKGYVRAIGVSNFLPVHMEALLKTAQVIPMVDQIEFHPGWMQPETAAFCKEHDILVEAWSPLGSGKLLEDPKLKEFGQKYGRSTAQICLRWCLQKGHLPLPKSVTPVRIKENLQLFDFQISQEDMAVIDKLECVGRTGSDPDNAKF